MKRLWVHFPTEGRPTLVGKERERFAEVINMLATLERLLDALTWLGKHVDFEHLHVAECHPSTSSAVGSNDLMLADYDGKVVVRCEVCDVASSSAAQNGKERKDLASLGCSEGLPADGVRRFICTSSEFATAIQSKKRKWDNCLHRYREFRVGDPAGTVLIEIVGPEPGC